MFGASQSGLLTKIGSAAPFHPTDITGCLVALRWNLGAMNAGGTLATDGQRVAEWRDQSGNGRHYSRATDNLRPFFRSSGALDFMGNIASGLVNSGGWAVGNNCTIVTRMDYRLPSNYLYPMSMPDNSTPVIYWASSPTAAAGIYSTPNDRDAYGSGLVDDQDYIFSLRKSTVSTQTVVTQLNDNTPTTQTSALMDWSSLHLKTIGNTDGLESGFQRHFMSMVIYNSVLSDTDLAKVKAWCAL